MALRSVLNEVIPDFEKQTGSTVEIKYGATARLTERIRGGARGDGRADHLLFFLFWFLFVIISAGLLSIRLFFLC